MPEETTELQALDVLVKKFQEAATVIDTLSASLTQRFSSLNSAVQRLSEGTQGLALGEHLRQQIPDIDRTARSLQGLTGMWDRYARILRTRGIRKSEAQEIFSVLTRSGAEAVQTLDQLLSALPETISNKLRGITPELFGKLQMAAGLRRLDLSKGVRNAVTDMMLELKTEAGRVSRISEILNITGILRAGAGAGIKGVVGPGLMEQLGMRQLTSFMVDLRSQFSGFIDAFSQLQKGVVLYGGGRNLGSPIFNFMRAMDRTVRIWDESWHIINQEMQRIIGMQLQRQFPTWVRRQVGHLREMAGALGREDPLREMYLRLARQLEEVASGKGLVSWYSRIGRAAANTGIRMIRLMGEQLLFGLSFGIVYLPIQQLILQPVEQATQIFQTLRGTIEQIAVVPQIGTVFQQFAQGLVQDVTMINQYINTLTGLFRSRAAAGSIVQEAIQIAKIQPIQFEQAIGLFQQFAIFPDIRQMLRGGVMRVWNEKFQEVPKVFSEMLVEAVQLLAMLNPEQGMKGAAFAIRELISGQYISLQRRFNITISQLASYAGTDVSRFMAQDPANVIRSIWIALNRMLGPNVLRLQGANLLIQLQNIKDVLQQAALETFIEIPFRLEDRLSPEELKNLASLADMTMEQFRTELLPMRRNLIGGMAGMVFDINRVIERLIRSSPLTKTFFGLISGFVTEIEKDIAGIDWSGAVDIDSLLQSVLSKTRSLVQIITAHIKTSLGGCIQEILNYAIQASIATTKGIMSVVVPSILTGLTELFRAPGEMFLGATTGVKGTGGPEIFKFLATMGTAMVAWERGIGGIGPLSRATWGFRLGGLMAIGSLVPKLVESVQFLLDRFSSLGRASEFLSRVFMTLIPTLTLVFMSGGFRMPRQLEYAAGVRGWFQRIPRGVFPAGLIMAGSLLGGGGQGFWGWIRTIGAGLLTGAGVARLFFGTNPVVMILSSIAYAVINAVLKWKQQAETTKVEEEFRKTQRTAIDALAESVENIRQQFLTKYGPMGAIQTRFFAQVLPEPLFEKYTELVRSISGKTPEERGKAVEEFTQALPEPLRGKVTEFNTFLESYRRSWDDLVEHQRKIADEFYKIVIGVKGKKVDVLKVQGVLSRFITTSLGRAQTVVEENLKEALEELDIEQAQLPANKLKTLKSLSTNIQNLMDEASDKINSYINAQTTLLQEYFKQFDMSKFLLSAWEVPKKLTLPLDPVEAITKIENWMRDTIEKYVEQLGEMSSAIRGISTGWEAFRGKLIFGFPTQFELLRQAGGRILTWRTGIRPETGQPMVMSPAWMLKQFEQMLGGIGPGVYPKPELARYAMPIIQSMLSLTARMGLWETTKIGKVTYPGYQDIMKWLQGYYEELKKHSVSIAELAGKISQAVQDFITKQDEVKERVARKLDDVTKPTLNILRDINNNIKALGVISLRPGGEVPPEKHVASGKLPGAKEELTKEELAKLEQAIEKYNRVVEAVEKKEKEKVPKPEEPTKPKEPEEKKEEKIVKEEIYIVREKGTGKIIYAGTRKPPEGGGEWETFIAPTGPTVFGPTAPKEPVKEKPVEIKQNIEVFIDGIPVKYEIKKREDITKPTW